MSEKIDEPKPIPSVHENLELPRRESRIVEDKDLLSFLVDDQALQVLWNRSSKAQEHIVKLITSKTQGIFLLDKIQMARNLILEQREKFDEADRLVAEVEHALELKLKIQVGSHRVAPWLFLYELIWLLVLGWLTFTISAAPVLSPGGIAGVVDLNHLINSLCWGGMGGVVGAMFALWKHVAVDQDFDSQYSMWYITNPIMGIALGGFVFLVIQAGFLSLTAGASGGDAIQSALVIYVLAWVCGFKQNVIYEIVRRILDVFKVNTSSKSETNGKDKTTDNGGVG